MKPEQNGRHFADNIFKCIFLNKNCRISVQIPLNFAPKGPTYNKQSLILSDWYFARCWITSNNTIVVHVSRLCLLYCWIKYTSMPWRYTSASNSGWVPDWHATTACRGVEFLGCHGNCMGRGVLPSQLHYEIMPWGISKYVHRKSLQKITRCAPR